MSDSPQQADAVRALGEGDDVQAAEARPLGQDVLQAEDLRHELLWHVVVGPYDLVHRRVKRVAEIDNTNTIISSACGNSAPQCRGQACQTCDWNQQHKCTHNYFASISRPSVRFMVSTLYFKSMVGFLQFCRIEGVLSMCL